MYQNNSVEREWKSRNHSIKSVGNSNNKITKEEASQYTERIRKGIYASRVVKTINREGANIRLTSWFCISPSFLLDEYDPIERVGFLYEDGRKAKDEFATKAYRLAFEAPKLIKIKKKLDCKMREDIVSVASVVLVETILSCKYDPSRGEFESYYNSLVKPKLYKYYNESGVIKVNNDDVRVELELKKACTEFYQKNEREAQFDDQVKMLPEVMRNLGKKPRKNGYGPEDVAYYNGINTTSFLSEPVGNGEKELGDLIVAPSRIANESEYEQELEKLEANTDMFLSTLGERNETIVRERGLDERYRPTMEEIAEQFGITKQRVDQICKESRKKMSTDGGLETLRSKAQLATECAVWI